MLGCMTHSHRSHGSVALTLSSLVADRSLSTTNCLIRFPFVSQHECIDSVDQSQSCLLCVDKLVKHIPKMLKDGMNKRPSKNESSRVQTDENE